MKNRIMNKQLGISNHDMDCLMEVFQTFPPMNAWSKVSEEDFTARRFTLGAVNNIICCEMTNKARPRLCKRKSDCSAIVIKFVSKFVFLKTNPVEDAAFHVLLSEHGLCPRVLLCNEKYIVYEYIQGKMGSEADLVKEETERQVARLLARFHSLEPAISISTGQKWEQTFLYMQNYIEKGVLNTPLSSLLEKYPKFCEKYNSLAKLDLLSMYDETRELMLQCSSPIVFAHSDFHPRNRIVTVEKDSNGNNVERIYLLDFDFCAYFYRAIDLGRHFVFYRWNGDYKSLADLRFPTDEEMETFLGEYRKEFAKFADWDYLAEPINSLEKLIKEAKIFAIHGYLLNIWLAHHKLLHCLGNDELMEKQFDILKSLYDFYKKIRKLFAEQGIIQV